jgi:hypothetical protein
MEVVHNTIKLKCPLGRAEKVEDNRRERTARQRIRRERQRQEKPQTGTNWRDQP